MIPVCTQISTVDATPIKIIVLLFQTTVGFQSVSRAIHQ